MIQLAVTDLMARRLVGEASISWRDSAMTSTGYFVMKQRGKATSRDTVAIGKRAHWRR
jgi:hypothetical protein